MSQRLVLDVVLASPEASARYLIRLSKARSKERPDVAVVVDTATMEGGWSVAAGAHRCSLARTIGESLTSRHGLVERRPTASKELDPPSLRIAPGRARASDLVGTIEDALFAARARGHLIVCTESPGRWLRARGALPSWVRRLTKAAAFQWDARERGTLLRWSAARNSPGCAATTMRLRGSSLDVFHACTNERFEVPARAMPILAGTEIASPERGALLEALGIDHDSPYSGGEAPVLVRRLAERKLAWAAKAVRAYGGYASLDALPIRTPREIAACFADFSIGGRTLDSAVSDRRLLIRSSGGTTTGTPRVLVVEHALRNERADAENLVWGRTHEPTRAILNRPGNLFGVPVGFDEVRAASERPGELRVTPGMNPTRVPQQRWARVHEALAAHAPQVLYGEANYLVGLARYMRARELSLPSIRELVLGYQLAWTFQRRLLASVFGTKPRDLYHSAEASAMGISCSLGHLHLLEVHTYYELLCGRVGARHAPLSPGGRGLLVLSLLDTRVQPLLRYAIGDVVRLRAASCACGRPGRVIELEGRLRHAFLCARGRVVTPRRLDALLDRALRALGQEGVRLVETLRTLQVRRDARGLVVSCVAPRSGQNAVSRLAAALGDALELPARGLVVSALPLAAPNGKLLTHDVPDEEDRFRRAILEGTVRYHGR